MAISSRFHTFMSPTYRPYEAVIRNLHHSTLILDISDALLELGHSTKRVVNANKNGHQLPLFFTDLKLDTNHKNILKLSSKPHIKIKVELPYRAKSDQPHCRNCHTYGQLLPSSFMPGLSVEITPQTFSPKEKAAHPSWSFARMIIIFLTT